MKIIDDSGLADVCVAVELSSNFKTQFGFGDFVRVISRFSCKHPKSFQVSYLKRDSSAPGTGIKKVIMVLCGPCEKMLKMTRKSLITLQKVFKIIPKF